MPSKIGRIDKKTEIDLRVAQELKNHSDFVDRINRSIQRLSEEVIKLSSNTEKVLSKYQSEKKSLEISFQGLDSKTKKLLEDFNKVQDEFRESLKREVSSISTYLASINDKAQRIEFLESDVGHLESSQRDLEENFKEIKSFIADQLSNFNRMCESFFEKKKLEFISKIPCVDHLEKMLDQKLQEIDCNQKGMKRELEIIKKSIQYGDKKFENIYTLIERLKAGK